MAKLSLIDRWTTEVHNSDDCAVCGGSAEYRSASNFCSKRCFDVAGQIRECCRIALRPYTDIGFRLTFLEGVYPTLGLPEFLESYYPGKAQRIYPIQPQEIQTVAQILPQLIPGMERELGKTVCDEVESAEKLWGSHFAQKRECFRRGIETRKFLDIGTFICPDCGGKWFDGDLTRLPDAFACCDKVQLKLPF